MLDLFGHSTLLTNLPAASFAPLRQATWVSIKAYGEIDEEFAFSEMPALTAELDACLANLERVWNMDEAAKAGLRSRARAEANLASYFRSDDYPAIAGHDSQRGTVEFAMLIDETGKVADCMVTTPAMGRLSVPNPAL